MHIPRRSALSRLALPALAAVLWASGATAASAQGTSAPAASAASNAKAAAAQVEGGWVRATVAGQQGTGAFMRITTREPMQLLAVRTPVAGEAEVHEMKMEGGVMRMRPAGAIALQPGQPLELKPGGLHLMLMDLKRPLPAGSQVPVTLVLKDAQGVERTVALQLPVAVMAPQGLPTQPH
ncbi:MULTISPECIES: copper chaperone PCu(A)C [Ramlibacter]|uniref:Copper chaperone PCu(A)C n=1 Tax=Ramlibacter aquaticus TaxID=2780094 RepID=A0ABR9SBL7_9BURK|nr:MULTISPECIES: copper chaperone PCu(A)C [Ramlibacter]MBE7939747.1 copper chaperone PCu(A)C [Ramlibacter aquaticus]